MNRTDNDASTVIEDRVSICEKHRLKLKFSWSTFSTSYKHAKSNKERSQFMTLYKDDLSSC